MNLRATSDIMFTCLFGRDGESLISSKKRKTRKYIYKSMLSGYLSIILKGCNEPGDH